MKKLILILMILFGCIVIFGCNDGSDDGPGDTPPVTDDGNTDDDSSGGDDTSDNDDSSTGGDDSSNKTNLYAVGYGEDGPCLQGGLVQIFPLNTATLGQVGENFKFQTTTDDNFGHYSIPIELDATLYPCAEVFITAQCHNEVTGGIMSDKMLSGIVCWADGESNNINPLTTIRTPIIRYLYNDPTSATYQDRQDSINAAETAIINYFGMPAITERFTNMTLQQGDTHDAVLVAANSALLYNKTEAEQLDFMSRISNDIKNGTTLAKNELKTALQTIPLKQIKDNLESRYTSLGMTIDTPPFWNVVDSDGDGTRNGEDSDSFVDLLDRVPVVKGIVNNEITSSTTFDTNDNKFFAFPVVISSDVTFKYIITNVNTDHISIYSNSELDVSTIHDDTPGAEIISSSKIPDDYFDATLSDSNGTIYNIPNEFSAKMETTLTAGNYWVIMSCDDFCQPTTGSPTGLVPFSRNLHSVDGSTWVGHNQSAPFFRSNKIKVVFTD